MTVDCPLDCEYLREARKHESSRRSTRNAFPTATYGLRRAFSNRHHPLMAFLGRGRRRTRRSPYPGAADPDVREAMESLVPTYRTPARAESVYETRPVDSGGGGHIRRGAVGRPEFLRREQQEFGMTRTRDADVLGILVYLQRMGRWTIRQRARRGRTLIDLLWEFYGDEAPPPRSTSSLILALKAQRRYGVHQDAPLLPGGHDVAREPARAIDQQLDGHVHRVIERQQVAFFQSQQVLAP